MAEHHDGCSCWLWAILIVATIFQAEAQSSTAHKTFSDCVKGSSRVTKNSFEHLPQDHQLYNAFVKRTFNSRYHWRKPAFVALPTSAQDVSNLIKCANKAGLKYVVRDGGHSYEGMSLIDQGVLIDMSKLNGVKVNTTKNSVLIGGGQRLGEVYILVFENGGYAFPGGNCAAVGVSGLTLGGGIGPNTRRLGMTVDTLRAATVVLADGTIATASASKNPDLFFAIRGGSGSFGVVTQWQFALTKAPTAVTVLEWRWPSFRVRDVFAAFATWKPYNLPEEYAKVEWFFGFGSISVAINYWGKKSDVETMIKTSPLFKVTDGHKTYLQELSYMDYMVKVTNLQGDSGWNKESLRVKNIVDLEYGPNAPDRYKANPFKAGSILMNTDLPDAAVVEMSNLLATNSMGWVQAKAMKGKVAVVGVDKTAYPHRDAVWLMQAYSNVNSNAEVEWVKSMKSKLAKYSTGLEYMNYIDCDVPKDRAWQTYFGPNAVRLQSIKKKYDPKNRFNAITC